MSTKLTKNNTPMVDSLSLELVTKAHDVYDQITHYLSNALKDMGYASASPAALSFLSALECGINHGSDIARNLGVSRQMVAKTVKEFCRVGYLEQVDAVGKQKDILFTKKGEQLISDARVLLADLDKVLKRRLGANKLQSTVNNLEQIQIVLADLNNK